MNKETKKGLLIVLWIFSGGMLLAMINLWPQSVKQALTFLGSTVFQSRNSQYITGISITIIVFLIYIVLSSRSNKDSIFAERKRSRFFKEIQSVLRNTLLPLGFNEKEKMETGGHSIPEKSVEFKLSEFTVFFWFNFKASSYNLDVYHLLKDEDGRNKTVQDYAITADITEADQFKNEVIEKLDKWLVEQGIK